MQWSYMYMYSVMTDHVHDTITVDKGPSIKGTTSLQRTLYKGQPLYKGPSIEGTTSLQRTHSISPTVYFCTDGTINCNQ